MTEDKAGEIIRQCGIWEARHLGLPKSKRTNEAAREWMSRQAKRQEFRDLMMQIIHPDLTQA